MFSITSRRARLAVSTAIVIAMAVISIGPASGAVVNSNINLVLNKTASVTDVLPGQPFSYDLTVTNIGLSDATDVVIRDTLPAGINFVSSVGSTCVDAGGGNLTCPIGATLSNGQSATVTINVMAAHVVAGVCPNVAVAGFADPTLEDNDMGANDEQSFVNVNCNLNPVIDLELTKSVSASVVPLGTSVTWTVTVVNKGPGNATAVTVSDKLPAGVTYVSDNSGGVYSAATGVWTIGNLAVGASASIQIVTTVDTQGIKQNRAQIATANPIDIDSTPGNCPALPAALGEDDCADAEVGTVLQASSTTTVPDTLVKTGVDSQTRNIGFAGGAVLLLGLGLVLAARNRGTAQGARVRRNR